MPMSLALPADLRLSCIEESFLPARNTADLDCWSLVAGLYVLCGFAAASFCFSMASDRRTALLAFDFD